MIKYNHTCPKYMNLAAHHGKAPSMQPVEYFLHHGHLWYGMGLHIHQQQQEKHPEQFHPGCCYLHKDQ